MVVVEQVVASEMSAHWKFAMLSAVQGLKFAIVCLLWSVMTELCFLPSSFWGV